MDAADERDDERAADRAATTSPRRPVEVGPPPDPDPTRRWALGAVLAVVAIVTLLVAVARRRHR